MRNEPTEQDVKELAALCLASLHDTEHGWRYRPREAAERILASDWYAERILASARPPHRGGEVINLTLTGRDAVFAVEHLRFLADLAHPSPGDPEAAKIAAACLSARYVAKAIEGDIGCSGEEPA